MTFQNIIQIQVLKFGILKRVESVLYWYVADYVAVEINMIISTRFKVSNVKFENKWECGLTEPEFVTGINDFSEEEITEYFCETCTRTHKLQNITVKRVQEPINSLMNGQIYEVQEYVYVLYSNI